MDERAVRKDVNSWLERIHKQYQLRRIQSLERDAWWQTWTQEQLGQVLIEKREQEAQQAQAITKRVDRQIETIDTMLLPQSPADDEEKTQKLLAIRHGTRGTGPIQRFERARPRQVETELDASLTLHEAVSRRVEDYHQTFGQLPGRVILSSFNAFYLASSYPGSFFVYRDLFLVPVENYHRLSETRIILCPEKQ